MKKNIKNFFMAVVTIVLSLASCGDLEEADRLILGDKEQLGMAVETSQRVLIDDEMFFIDNLHRILIADFTGWACVNCPKMAEFLTSKIITSYPSVLVSLHMNSAATSKNHPNGYNCASADSIFNWISGGNQNSIGLPAVSLDNVSSEEGILMLTESTIEKTAQNRFKDTNINKKTPRVSLGINTNMSEVGKYDVSVLVIAPQLHNVRLQVWLIEEELISSYQMSLTGLIYDYENHGILRQVVNGSYEGQLLQLESDGYAIAHSKLDINGKNYKIENCRIVAIVTDSETREVLNCLEASL